MGSFICLLISILPLLKQGHYQPSYSYQPTKIYHQKPVYSHKQVYQYEPQEPTYGYEPTCSTLSFCSSSCPSSYNSYNRRSWWIIIYTIMFSSFYISSNINLTSFNMLVRWAGEGRWPWATTISSSVPHISFFSLLADMSHQYFPFRTTIFGSSGQSYFFKWYILDL